jgi:hypothetical protein
MQAFTFRNPLQSQIASLHRFCGLSLIATLAAMLGAASSQAANILYIVNPVNGSLPSAAHDVEIYNRLVGQGHTVTVIQDANANMATFFPGKDLIIISSSVGSATQPLAGLATSDLKTRNVPIIDYEPGLYDEMLLQTSTVFGNTAGQTDIYITQLGAGHPLGAGNCEGTLRVTTGTGVFSGGALPLTLGTDAILIASNSTPGHADIARPCIFAYEAGARLADNSTVTPARRVCSYLNATTAAGGYNTAGLALFDAEVTWALAVPTSNSPPSLTSNPTNTTVQEGASVTFRARVGGTPPYVLQWQRSSGGGAFTNIPGATCAAYTIGPLSRTDSGAIFRAFVSNSVGTVLSSNATLTVLVDTNPPVMVSALGSGTPTTTFDLTFSEPVDPGTASEAGNYELADGSFTLFSAMLDTNGRTVHFVSDPITNGIVLRVTAGVSIFDRALTPNALRTGDPGSSIAIITTGGSIRRHVYNNIGAGVLVSDLTNHFRFPNSPDVVDFPTSFEDPNPSQDVAAYNNYGVHLLGYLTPPLSANYHFYMASDDGGALYLSTDDKPANKVLIAREPQWANAREWTGNAANPAGRTAGAPENQSKTLFPAGIPLTAGRRYYVEAFMKEGAGGNNLGVAWQGPSDPIPVNGSAPISGLYLTAYNVPASVPTNQPADITTPEGRSVTFSVIPSGSPFLSLQWYENSTPLPNATNASFMTPLLVPGDSGKKYSVVLSNSVNVVTSRLATLTVFADNTPPRLIAAASLNATDIGLCFDEIMDLTTATNPANYTVNSGAIGVTSAKLRYDGSTVLLTLATNVTNGFIVSVSNLRDLSTKNIIAAGTRATGNVAGLTPIDIGTAGDPLAPGSSFTCQTGEFELIAGGSDIWGNADHGHFAYQSINGNFDKRVKVARMDNTSTSAKAGFMVRDGLAAGARNLHAIVMPPVNNPPSTIVGRNIYEAGTRRATDGATDGWGIAGGAGGVNGNIPANHPNSWVRMRRIGAIWKSYASSNGLDWVQFGQSEQLYPNSVFFLLESGAVNNDGSTNRVLFQNLSDTIAPGASVTITQQPVNVAIDANHDVSFTAAASATGVAASEIGYQWQKGSGGGGFTNINAIGANGTTLTILATAADNGAQFRLIASVPGASATSSVATVTVTNDLRPPLIVSAVRSCLLPNTIALVFSERVSAGSATEVSNYSINDGAIAVSTIVLLADGKSVVITAGAPIPDGAFDTISLQDVQALAGTGMPPTKVLIRLAGGRTVVGGQIVFEAENFDANTPATDGHFFTFMNTAVGVGTFSGAGYMQSFPETGAAINQPGHTAPGASPRLDYCINFPSAGTWRVWVRGVDAGGGNSVHIGLDGISAANENFRIGNTGGASGWDGTWKWTRDANDLTTTFAAVVVTNAGAHVFNIWMREDRTCVDKILLTLDTAFVFSPNTINGPNETPIVDATSQVQMTVRRSGNSITITSNLPTSAGKLQEATEIAGPWSDVVGGNPGNYTVSASAAKKFYRIASP